MINANIARHFHRSDDAVMDDRRPRERRIPVSSDQVTKTGSWNSSEDGTALQASGPASLEIEFTGAGINLNGWREPGGGSARIWINGEPADTVNAFYATYIQPDADNFIDLDSSDVNFRRHISDRCPHGISLGENLQPQTWTIAMTSDAGDYSVTGSLTGVDGKGNAFQPFTSSRGQIMINPELWRLAKTNRSGDKFTFQVIRNAQPMIDFSGEKEKIRVRLVDGLPKGKHTLRLEVESGSRANIEAFELFRPPLP